MATATMSAAPALPTPAWVPATPDSPCPVCGQGAGCAVDRDDPELVLCSNADSAVPVSGGGWVHVVVRRRRRQRDRR